MNFKEIDEKDKTTTTIIIIVIIIIILVIIMIIIKTSINKKLFAQNKYFHC